MPGKLLRPARVTRAEVRSNPDTLYVFGDNMARQGFGGQAREMRGEPNAVGVPTKWRPDRSEDAYFTDQAWMYEHVERALDAALDQIESHLRAGETVAIPADGLGTGLAELPSRAPRIHAYIERRIRELEEIVSEKEG